jgi:hypothetical protein
MPANDMHPARRPARILAGVIAVAASAAAPAARADAIANWNLVASNTINTTAAYPRVTPEELRPVVQVDLATVHVAIYDAVNAIVGGYQPFAVAPTSPTVGASPESAAGAAACTVLRGLFPNRAPVYATACLPYQAGSTGTAAHVRGVAVGIESALGVLALRANDGRSTVVTYVPSVEPGKFSPSPATPTPVSIFVPFIRPFTMTSASQFRADGPPDLGSATYAEDLNEVKAWGGAVSALRTPEQSEIARFHTEPPPAFWTRNLRQFSSNDHSLADNARLMAMMWVTHADLTVACFESKYHYNFWRPRAAIPAAATDGNDATDADSGWLPFVPTPNHPEYPAAHACTAGGTAEVLKAFYGSKKLSFNFTSTVTGLTHHFDSTDDMVKELQVARIYGGMHFRTSAVHGRVLGMKVGKWVTTNYFQPVK